MDVRLNPAAQTDTTREQEVEKRKLRDACREFESVMVSYLMKTMREGTIRADEPDSARDMYEDMFSSQISREIGKSSGMGLGEMLYKSLEPTLKAKFAKANATHPAVAGSSADTPVPPAATAAEVWDDSVDDAGEAAPESILLKK